eukprot:jgi/Chrzof1/5754/Cz16g14180.t1
MTSPAVQGMELDVPLVKPTRQQLAAAGTQQVDRLLGTCTQLLDACKDLGVATNGSTDAEQQDVASRLHQTQQQYLAISQQLRHTVRQCQQLEAEEAVARAAAASGKLAAPCAHTS